MWKLCEIGFGIDTTKKAMEMLQERDKERIGLLYLYFWHQN